MIIGIHGRKGSGKSTAAAYLVHKHDFIEYTFADPLKRACKDLYVLRHSQVYGSQEDKERVDARWGVTPRWLMQRTGSALRAVFEDIFVRHMEAIIADTPAAVPIVISDVRFPNEAQFIRSRGGIIVTLVRSGAPLDMHESESQVIEADFTLYNDGEKEVLFDTFQAILNTIRSTSNTTKIQSAPLDEGDGSAASL